MSWFFRVKDVELRDVFTVDSETTIREAARLMIERGVDFALITVGGTPSGIITERDILRKVVAKGLNPDHVKTGEVMSAPLITVDTNVAVAEAIELMLSKNINRLVAVEGGRLRGVFSSNDVLNVYRTCLACRKPVPLAPQREVETQREGAIECECGARYHKNCASQVVHCLSCQASLVTSVVYPKPEETTGG